MRVSSRTQEWMVIVQVTGELDAATAPELRQLLYQHLDEGTRWMLTDFQELEYIDSVGLGLLINVAKRVGEVGGKMAVVCARPNVLRVFEISGTSELLNLRQVEAQACSLLEEHYRQTQPECSQEEGEGND